MGDVPKLTKRVNKDVLVSLLTTDVFKEDKSIEFKELLKRLRKEKDILFHTDDVPKKNMGQLHALCLQLVAKGIVELVPKDKSRIGSDKFSEGDVFIKLGNGVNARGLRMPAYMIDSYWEGLNLVLD